VLFHNTIAGLPSLLSRILHGPSHRVDRTRTFCVSSHGRSEGFAYTSAVDGDDDD
jgi:hypothetical protein